MEAGFLQEARSLGARGRLWQHSWLGRARGLLGCGSPLPCVTVGDRRAPDTPAQPSFPSGPLLFSSLTSLVFSPALVEGESTDPYTMFL